MDGTACWSHALHRQDGVAVVPLTGELDISCAEELRQVLLDELQSGAVTVVADLREVSFVDSTVLGVFVAVHQVAEEGAGTSISRIPVPARRRFWLSPD